MGRADRQDFGLLHVFRETQQMKMQQAVVLADDARVDQACTSTANVLARAAQIEADDALDADAVHRARELAIKKRIEGRLPGRVRNLAVRSFDGVVILEGECSTFYTKQLAQHAAMGVLQDELLDNAIVVCVK